MSRYDVRTKIVDGEPNSLGFKYPNDSYKVRKFPKEFYSLGDISKAGLFGKDKFALGSAKYVTITEGELDALSLSQILGAKAPVVSVQSSGSARRDCLVDWDWLNAFERIYLALDGDEPGQRAAREIAALFDYDKVYHVRFDKRKDANEYLEAGEEQELNRIWWNSRRFAPEGVDSTREKFKELLLERPQRGASYPFPLFDQMTYGLKPDQGEVLLLKALEGVGKTKLIHTFVCNWLKETSDEFGLGVIHLEESKGDFLRGIVGTELEVPLNIPGTIFPQSEIDSALDRLVRKDDRLHILDYPGSDDPDLLLDTVRFLAVARACRIIVVDTLSMVFSGSSEKDERLAIDRFVTKFVKMASEHKFAGVLTAHINTMGLTRGSTYPDKACHTVVEAHRNVRGIDPTDGRTLTEEEKNTISLLITKNRLGQKTGPAGKLLFNPYTSTLKEKIVNA
jgi:twinkle protein